jgi:hypothetical protein
MAERQQERAELVKAMNETAQSLMDIELFDEADECSKVARLLEEDGKEIDAAGYLIVDLRQKNDGLAEEQVRLRDRAEKAEARVSELEQALEELGQAHRLLAAQGLMAACADEGKDQ